MTASLSFVTGLRDVNPGVYCEADFRAIARLAHAEAGIVLPDRKATLVYARLATLVRNSGCGTFAAYVTRIGADPDERRRAISALTTNHTFFYREAHHFEHFASEVRRGLIGKLEAGRSVRIWSAGCASGEETWSLVMTLLGESRSEGNHLAARDVLVLGTDISDDVLARAQAATYEAEALAQVPSQLRRNWAKDVAGTATMTDEARRIARFRALNLQADWPMKRSFDAVFCRNVMIYFDCAAKERLLARFAETIVPGGYLYLGHSEQISGPALQLFECAGTTTYRRKP